MNASGGLSVVEERLLRHVRSLQAKQLVLTRELMAISTVNPYSGDSYAGTESMGQRWIEARLLERGAAVRRLSVPPDVYIRAGVLGPRGRCWKDRDNIVGSWTFGDGDGPTVIVNDHMDTVGADGWTTNPFDPRLEDGKVWGLGASDTKGNMILGLMAVEGLLMAPETLRGRLIFESVVDEECDGSGAGTLACCLAGIHGDVAIVLDGAGGHPYNEANGVITPRLLIQGASGHSACGNDGRALDLAIEVKAAMDVFVRAHQERYPGCPAGIGVFRCGTCAAIVPDRVEIVANLFYPPEEAERADRQTGQGNGALFRQRFEKAMAAVSMPWNATSGARMDLEWIKDLYPYRLAPDSPLFECACQAVAAITGRQSFCRPMPAWCDASHFVRQLGMPTVGLGFGAQGCAHSTAEYVEVDALFQGAQVVALLLHRLLRAPHLARG